MRKLTYKTWSRKGKGKCPGCGAGTGCKHKENCPTRIKMLADLILDKKKSKKYYPHLEKLQKQLREIESWTDDQLLSSFEFEAGVVYMATKEMRRKLAENTRKDLWLIKAEIIRRLHYRPLLRKGVI